jgi:predicted nuclease of predicted toxin-antitoxin system
VNFLADESVDGQIVERLRRNGHLVEYIAEMEPGISDELVLEIANQENLLLLTADRDFGELVFRQGLLGPGIVLIRLEGLSPTTKAGMVNSAIDQYGSGLSQRFSVVAPGTIRIRRQTE